jgi:hypothetical protein
MNPKGILPSISELLQRGVGNTAGMLIDGYGKFFSAPVLYSAPIDLEPPFCNFIVPFPFTPEKVQETLKSNLVFARKKRRISEGYSTIRFWFSESDKITESIGFWQEAGFLNAPASILCVGNSARIQIILAVSSSNVMSVTSLLTSKMPHIQCEAESDGKILKELAAYLNNLPGAFDYGMLDVVTPPPFFRSMNAPNKDSGSPFMVVFSALRNITPPGVGVVRILFAAAEQPWSRLMSEVVQYEAGTTHLGFVPNDVLKASLEKANNNPLYTTSIWLSVVSNKEDVGPILNSMAVPFKSLRYGNETLSFLTSAEYKTLFKSKSDFVDALLSTRTYRVGSLLTSLEMELCFSFPRQELLQNADYMFLKTIAVQRPKPELGTGLKLGYAVYAGIEQPIYQPEKLCRLHTSIIGKTGKGKSIALGQMAIEMHNAGIGYALIDPHNNVIPFVMERIDDHWEDVIYYDPSDHDWVLKFNITAKDPSQDAGKIADDLTAAVQAQYSHNAWGENISFHLRNLLEIALSVPGMNLPEMVALTETGYHGDDLRQKALPYLNNPELIRYIEEVLPDTPRDQMSRVVSKITKFLQKEYTGRMFYERENAFNFRNIMDRGKKFLANVPAGLLSGSSCNLICSTIATYFHHAALSRQDVREEERKTYCLLMDEYQRITTHDSQDALRECRKHGLGLYMAFQQQSQMSDTIRTALANCGTICAFDLGLDDAQAIFKEFYGEVPLKTLMHKGVGSAICMMDGNIVNLRTYTPSKPPKNNHVEEIRERSRSLYYVHRDEAEYYKIVKRHAEGYEKKKHRKNPIFGQYDDIS